MKVFEIETDVIKIRNFPPNLCVKNVCDPHSLEMFSELNDFKSALWDIPKSLAGEGTQPLSPCFKR